MSSVVIVQLELVVAGEVDCDGAVGSGGSSNGGYGIGVNGSYRGVSVGA